MILFLSILTAYLLGSIPFGLFVAKAVMGIDIRQHGSGNIGTTNVFRVVGKKWGLVVFSLDACKGVAGVLFACMISSQTPGSSLSYAYALSSILGHTFPIWLKFKGGKGIATSLGVFMATAFLPTSITFAIWVLVFTLTHIVSISSLVAAIVFPISSLILVLLGKGNPILIPLSLLLCAFIFYTHRENIRRLRAGQEKKIF